MRIVDIRERSLPISRYADPAVPSGGLTTSMVAAITDVVRDGEPVVGYGFASIGRFAQGGVPIFMYFLGTIPQERYDAALKPGAKPLPERCRG